MRKSLAAALALIAMLAAPGRADAWGFAGHQLIMARAIDLLPPELKSYFQENRQEMIFRVVDPDLWRNVGWEDDPNHFMDFGASEYGAYPFQALPRDYDAALQKFGKAILQRNGLLPWREAEMFGNLRRSFEGFARGALYSRSDSILFAAVAAHYAQDARQPFHATDNFDGGRTGNYGIHARFERDLIERFASRLKLNPAPAAPVTNPRDAAFDALLASHKLVDAVLAADNEAKAGKTEYDDDYFEKFFTKVQPILERQLSDSITATAGVIIGAWEQAGRPKVPARDPRPVQKIRR